VHCSDFNIGDPKAIVGKGLTVILLIIWNGLASISLYQVGERRVRVASDIVDFTTDNGAPAAAKAAEEVNLSVHVARLRE
jgi:hypothetical protein